MIRSGDFSPSQRERDPGHGEAENRGAGSGVRRGSGFLGCKRIEEADLHELEFHPEYILLRSSVPETQDRQQMVLSQQGNTSLLGNMARGAIKVLGGERHASIPAMQHTEA